MVTVNERKTTMVKPAEATPKRAIWLANLDLFFKTVQTPNVYFYRPNGASNFFDPSVLREALSKALVPFYPVAGRLRHDDNGRPEIYCNAEGVVFIEAESASSIDDFADFRPSLELQKLAPIIDCSGAISSHPLCMLQVTYFKCGGVALGVGMLHCIADGISAIHFVNTWCHMARGLDLAIPPFLDRTLLGPRNPPQHSFDHIEYQLPKLSKSQDNGDNFIVSQFKLPKEKVDKLKVKAKEDSNNTINYSTYEVLASHIWKCACIAIGYPDEEEIRLTTATEGRNRLQPPLPPGYFGNVIFTAAAAASAGDLKSKALGFATKKVHDTLVRMDDEYLRSSIDFLELYPDLLNGAHQARHDAKFNVLGITSWVRMPVYVADFGWGKPFYMGPTRIIFEGKAYILPNTVNDGSYIVAIGLKPKNMEVFEKLLCDVWRINTKANH